MTIDASMLLPAFGCLLLLIGIVGGFELKEVKIPRLGPASRIMAGLSGAVLLGFSIAGGEIPLFGHATGASASPSSVSAAPSSVAPKPSQPVAASSTAATAVGELFRADD